MEFLQCHKPKLLKEIRNVIENIDANGHKTKISRENKSSGRFFYNPTGMNAEFKKRLTNLNWRESRVGYWVTGDEKLIRKTLNLPFDEQKREIEKAGGEAISSYNQTDFIKERVAVEVQFGKYAFVAYDLFVKHLAFFIGDKIDLGIEIIPMKSMQKEMSSGPAYYEGELYNVVRQGRGVPAVPLIMIGVEP
jgi:hypothetical protein